METMNSMDRMVEPKKGIRLIFSKKYLSWWIGGMVLAFIIYLIARPNVKMLRINNNMLTISTVQRAEFNDYIRISGQVQPMTTVQLSPQEGGVVQEIIAEEGSKVRCGDVIIVLNNESLDLQILNSEAELAEKENILRNTLIQMEQQKLSLQQEKLQLSVEVRRAKRDFDSKKALYDEELISKEEYLQSEENYDLALNRLQLVENRVRQDSIYRSVEVEQMNESLANMRINMQMIRKRKDNLSVKAPIDGELGLLDVALGQSVGAGMRIGQINNLDSYKIEAQIDEHYIDRVMQGLSATFERQGESFGAVLRKVYPEVREGKFKAEFKFDGEQPENIRTGQTYYLNLQLGQPAEGIIIQRGSFYQKTGGKWIYVLSEDGTKAEKRNIRIGRQNPQYYEVLEGLQPGEKVIVSGYESFGDNDVLVIKD